MNILLISGNTCIDPFPVYPLGISVTAAALMHAGHKVRQADVLVSGFEGVRNALTAQKYGLIGIGVRNIDLVNSARPDARLLDASLELVRQCRELTDAPVVLGGAGFSLLPEALLQLSGADYGVVGEGEIATVELAAALAAGIRPPRLLHGRPGPQSGACYDPEILRYYCDRTHQIPFQTKRGCAERCVYCTYPALEGARVRPRGADSIPEEIAVLRRARPDAMLSFTDAVFNDPAGAWREVLDRIADRCGPVPFAGFLTPRNLTETDCDRLARAGMTMAEVGIDGASDTALRGLGKGFTFAAARQCVRRLLDRGIGVSCSVMFGGPGETPESIREGIENLRTLAPAVTAVFAGVRILPGAPLAAAAAREGKIPTDWDGVRSLYYWADGLIPDEVRRTLLDAFGTDRHVLYPPDRENDRLRTIHRIGYLKFRKLLGGETAAAFPRQITNVKENTV